MGIFWMLHCQPNPHRPNRSAQQGVGKAQEYIVEGHTWVVDLDLEKFFVAPGEAERFQRV
jgi:hypothetical protein